MEMPNGGFVPNEQAPPASTTGEQSTAAAAVPGSEPAPKRRPGRPKGSTKKNLAGEGPVARVKRPVGRPRKDGFPAGSVGPPRPRPKPATAPPWPQQQFSYQLAIDPNLQSPGPAADDWPVLARTNPNAFLAALLAALTAPNPVSTAGPTVEEAFKSHLNSLTPVSSQHQPIPSLYSILKTFWLPSSPAYFSLTASASTARTPSEHRFLYWDPQPLVFNGIACPGCATPLVNQGRISTGPIKIYDIEKPFFVIGCEYVCRSAHCLAAFPDGRKFASTDASIFRALPAKLKDEFPARLLCADTDSGSGPNVWNWSPWGVSLSLWNLVRACLRSGMRKEAILQLFEAVQRGVPEDEPVQRQGAGASVSVGATGKHVSEGATEAQRDAAPGEGGGPPAGNVHGEGEMNHEFVQTFIDAYHDAWKANNGAAQPQPQPQPQPPPASSASAGTPGRANSTTPQPQPAQLKSPSNPPQPQVFDYIKSLANYPYGVYSYLPTTPPPVSISASASTSAQSPSQPPAPAPAPTSVPTSAPVPAPLPVPVPVSAADSVSPPTPGTSASASTSLKRPYPFAPDDGAGAGVGGTSGVMDSSKRSPRHCCKCGSQDCKGKGGRSFCANGCQDCGKLECRGRNSRRPDKKCSEGWV